MIQIGTYVHGGGNIEEKIVAIKNAGFDFVAIGMGAFSDDNLEYQVELCEKYGIEYYKYVIPMPDASQNENLESLL